MDVDFQETRILPSFEFANVIIKADGVWFDADSTGWVARSC